jgi:hypothetical protein
LLALVQKRRAQAAEAKKAAAPRRTTAPPPGGALTSDGRRLVREEGAVEEDEAAPPRSPRRAAATGAALGLIAVLVIFGAVRVLGRGRTATQAPTTAQSAAMALPAATAEAPTAATAPGTPAPGTPTANVPLFGATPLSTTEPAPGASPSPSASAVASAAGAPTANDDDDAAPGDDKGGTVLKEWGQGPVNHPVVLKIKMDGPIERITGASGAMGFTISVPGRRPVSTAAVSELTRKDKRLASVSAVNTPRGAEVTVQFKDGVPPYVAKAKGNRLEIAIGKEKKVAKKKKSKHKDG